MGTGMNLPIPICDIYYLKLSHNLITSDRPVIKKKRRYNWLKGTQRSLPVKIARTDTSTTKMVENKAYVEINRNKTKRTK